MARYKFGNEEETAVSDTEKSIYNITPEHGLWKEYEVWLAEPNVTDPFRTSDEHKAYNVLLAQGAQVKLEQELDAEAKKETYNLPPTMTPEEKQERIDSIALLQGDVDNPTDDPVYNPPLPPGVNPPPHETLIVTVTRILGWQDNLGYKAVIESMAEDFSPTNLAMSVYTNSDCDGYLYTTGAFAWNDPLWEAICPAGQEPGDVDINFGVLYGAAQLACFTLPAGQQSMIVNVYTAL